MGIGLNLLLASSQTWGNYTYSKILEEEKNEHRNSFSFYLSCHSQSSHLMEAVDLL